MKMKTLLSFANFAGKVVKEAAEHQLGKHLQIWEVPDEFYMSDPISEKLLETIFIPQLREAHQEFLRSVYFDLPESIVLDQPLQEELHKLWMEERRQKQSLASLCYPVRNNIEHHENDEKGILVFHQSYILPKSEDTLSLETVLNTINRIDFDCREFYSTIIIPLVEKDPHSFGHAVTLVLEYDRNKQSYEARVLDSRTRIKKVAAKLGFLHDYDAEILALFEKTGLAATFHPRKYLRMQIEGADDYSCGWYSYYVMKAIVENPHRSVMPETIEQDFAFREAEIAVDEAEDTWEDIEFNGEHKAGADWITEQAIPYQFLDEFAQENIRQRTTEYFKAYPPLKMACDTVSFMEDCLAEIEKIAPGQNEILCDNLNTVQAILLTTAFTLSKEQILKEMDEARRLLQNNLDICQQRLQSREQLMHSVREEMLIDTNPFLLMSNAIEHVIKNLNAVEQHYLDDSKIALRHVLSTVDGKIGSRNKA